MTTIKVTKQTSVTFGRMISLGDLRAFLDSCDGIGDKAAVSVKHHDAIDQRDDTYTEITVHGAA